MKNRIITIIKFSKTFKIVLINIAKILVLFVFLLSCVDSEIKKDSGYVKKIEMSGFFAESVSGDNSSSYRMKKLIINTDSNESLEFQLEEKGLNKDFFFLKLNKEDKVKFSYTRDMKIHSISKVNEQ